MNTCDYYIFKIVATGSLTKAAEVLGISQPALSLGLNKLEKELGFKIFNRKTVPLTFTKEGQIYYDYIKRSRILQEDFKLRISSLQESYNSKVVIGGPEVYIGGLLSSAVNTLLALHPHYFVGMKSASIGQLIELTANREIDCFISTTDKLPANLVNIPFKKEKIYLCIPKTNPLNLYLKPYEVRTGDSNKLIDFSCLDGKEFIFLEEWQPLQKRLLSLLKRFAIKPANRIVVNQVSSLLNMSVASGNLCIASEIALNSSGLVDQFCLYLLPDTVSGRMLYVSYDKDLYVSEATQEFIKLLTETGGEKE